MSSITGNAAIDVLIGLFFLFFLLSIVCSAINEGVAQLFNLRARTLETGIHNLLGSAKNVEVFFSHWRVQILSKPRLLFPSKSKPRHPSYIPSGVFALTVLDTLAPGLIGKDDQGVGERTAGGASDKGDGAAEGQPTSEATGVGAGGLVADAARIVAALPDARVRNLLESALIEARGDIDQLRQSLERSFDEVMDRASGWYKRRVQIILFVIALALVGSINADSFAIGQRLWKDDTLRASVVAQAVKAVSSQNANSICKTANNAGQSATPADIAKCVDQIKEIGIPLGWSGQSMPTGWGIPGKALGLLVTAFSLLLGAPFWFDLLGKVAGLRGSGPPVPGAAEKDKAASQSQAPAS